MFDERYIESREEGEERWNGIRTTLPLVTSPLVRSKQLDSSLHWIEVDPVSVHCWFAFPAVHSQICSGVPFAVAPPVTSRHHLSSTCKVDPEIVQFCKPLPPVPQCSMTTAAPFASDAAVRHISKSSARWIF
jgi:hypothetical protein